MRPELQQQVLALFEQVVDLPAAERQRALESARAEWPDACAQVESLLGHDVTADEADFLQNAEAASQGAPPSDSMAGRPDLQAGTDREAHSTDVEKTANLQTAGAGLLDAMPERFGRYRMVRLLDQGAFASVYLGQDEDLDRPVAVKLALADRFRSEADVTRYLDEARKAARLRHPGIVSIYDAGRLDDGRCYVVMEYRSKQKVRSSGESQLQIFDPGRLARRNGIHCRRGRAALVAMATTIGRPIGIRIRQCSGSARMACSQTRVHG